MDLLYANDTAGQHPRSWYAETAQTLPPFAPLDGETRVHVCIVGGGFTGLSAALHLAELGVEVLLVEAHRAGFGASGRNGGQLGSGQRVNQLGLEKMLGADAARTLWDMGADAKALVRRLIAEHDIACHLKDGIALAGSTQAQVDDLHRYADHLATAYDYAPVEALDAKSFAALCPSPDYTGGMLDMGAGHLHPLALCFGLAQAAVAAGARICEDTHVKSIARGDPAILMTDKGRIVADHVILAANGYLGGLDAQVASRVMPINNFVVATERLGERAAEVLTRDIAVSDSRFVVNYFRLSHDKRLLFGGGESYGYRFPSDIAAKVRKPMMQIFPSLRDVAITHAWGGTLAITMKRMPYLTRLAPNVLSASGYSGHGVGNAVQAGALMAQAVRGQADGFDTMSAIPSVPFPGGVRLRNPLLALAMSWYALRDRLGT